MPLCMEEMKKNGLEEPTSLVKESGAIMALVLFFAKVNLVHGDQETKE